MELPECQISSQYPAQVVERYILHQCAARQTERHGGHGCHQLRPSSAAQQTGHQSGQDHCHGLGYTRKKPESCQRCTKQLQGQSPEERCDRGICHISPRQMACVFQRSQFIALEAIFAAAEYVNHHRGDCQTGYERQVARPKCTVGARTRGGAEFNAARHRHRFAILPGIFFSSQPPRAAAAAA